MSLRPFSHQTFIFSCLLWINSYKNMFMIQCFLFVLRRADWIFLCYRFLICCLLWANKNTPLILCLTLKSNEEYKKSIQPKSLKVEQVWGYSEHEILAIEHNLTSFPFFFGSSYSCEMFFCETKMVKIMYQDQIAHRLRVFSKCLSL